MPFSADLSATQSPGSDEDGYRTTAEASRSTKRKFEELPMPKLGPQEFVIDGLFYCPWSEWPKLPEWHPGHPKEEIVCDAMFLSNRDRQYVELGYIKLSTMMLTMPRRHIKTHVKPVLCPYTGCPTSMAEQRDMRKHVETHKNQTARLRFPCPDCGKKFTRHDNIPRHQEKAHGVEAQM